MDKTVVGLLGGASALAFIAGAQGAVAEPADAMQPARSYAELLNPIPNAVERLQADNQREASVELAQYFYYGAPYHHHHHHHHHHHRYYYGYLPNPYYHHHHHHHHHHHVVIPIPY
jgi:hypothetical protein